jgi:hypothetical protein
MGEWTYSSTIIDLGTRGGEWSASNPGCFTPQGKSSRYPLDGRLVGPQSLYGHCEEDKSCLCRESNPGRQARSRSLYRLSYPVSVIFVIVSEMCFFAFCSHVGSTCFYISKFWHSVGKKTIPITGHGGP